MNVYKKLKIAILAILASQNIHAITLDPIQIQSAPGELLYAEINFRNSDPNSALQAGLASAEDLIAIGTGHQPPGHLNFFTRRDGSGNGVITITSSRPITDAELNIIVKITEGNAARLQQVKIPLKRSPAAGRITAARNERPLAPMRIVNEKDIALNLPVSTLYAAAPPAGAAKAGELPLAISRSAPPGLIKSSPAAPAIAATALRPQPLAVSVPAQPPAKTAAAVQAKAAAPHPETVKAQPAPQRAKAAPPPPAAPNSISSDPLAKKFAAEMATQKAQAPAPKAQPAAVKAPAQSQAPGSQAAAAQQYVVQSNETLWGIASRMAAQQNRPVSEVMKQIKASNQHAFIQGDANRLRRGVALNLGPAAPAKQPVRVPAAELAKVPSAQSGKTKYRLNQAEMSLVAEKAQDSARASANEATEKNQTSNELSLKVMTSREKTVKLQRNVTQLELALNQKDHRIQLLNARLAQLQQQLKARQAEKKPIN